MNDSHIIKGRWRPVRKLGAGAFGEIYSAVDLVTGDQVAIKVEKCDTKKQVLRLEVAVLKKMQGCAQIAKFISCGRSNDYNYVVMELLGENLSDLRRKQANQRFSVSTSARLGAQMLRGIQSCHKRGFLHRDIKPSNFALGLQGDKQRMVFIIDFGLARRYRLPTGEIRPPRETAGFRGTARYASISSHQSKELARRDDLWSLFYVMVEFLAGQLPWRRLKEKDEILRQKLKYTNHELVRGLPSEMKAFLDYLQTLQYDTEPDYDYLSGLFADMLARTGQDESSPFDWEAAGAASTSAHLAARPPEQQVPANASFGRVSSLKRQQGVPGSAQAGPSQAGAGGSASGNPQLLAVPYQDGVTSGERAEGISESVQETPVPSTMNARYLSQGMEASFATDEVSVSPAPRGPGRQSVSMAGSMNSAASRNLSLPSPKPGAHQPSAGVRASMPRGNSGGSGQGGREISVTPANGGAAAADGQAGNRDAQATQASEGCCKCTIM